MYSSRLSRFANPQSTRSFHESKSHQEPENVPRDLTSQAVRDLKVVFVSFQDTDRGIVSVSQLADIVELLGDPRPDIALLRTMVGRLSDDSVSPARVIDFKMFLRFFVTHLYGGNLSVRSREIFSAFDSDTNASVSALELQESLRSMGMSLNEEEALAMTSVADGSMDGEVNYHEFKQICRRIDSELTHCQGNATPSVRTKINTTKKMTGLRSVNAWARSPLTSPTSSPGTDLSRASFQKEDAQGNAQ